jgi:hypothetical protein
MNFTDEDLAYPFLWLSYRIERATPQSSLLCERHQVPVGQPINITYGVRQQEGVLDRVIDLRDPETQQWFLDTFVALEIQHEEEVMRTSDEIFPRKEPITSFGELLKSLVSLETGGGMIFSQAVGHWLRKRGANGLIFPSARSNAFNKVQDGRSVDWGGWNLVVYADAGPPVEMNLFGQMGVWRDRDHNHIRVNYVTGGPTRGSFSIRGPREFNILEFDWQKQFAQDGREASFEEKVTGRHNAAVSGAVNDLLDEEEEAGTLWYGDVNFINIVRWLEKRWRESRP